MQGGPASSVGGHYAAGLQRPGLLGERVNPLYLSTAQAQEALQRAADEEADVSGYR